MSLPAARRGAWCLAAAYVLVCTLGCGPVQTTSILMDARAELAAAQQANAAERAPYEYEMARAYLEEAREQQARSQFETAVTYGRQALGCARVATEKATGQPGKPAECQPVYELPEDEPPSTEATGTSTAGAAGP